MPASRSHSDHLMKINLATIGSSFTLSSRKTFVRNISNVCIAYTLLLNIFVLTPKLWQWQQLQQQNQQLDRQWQTAKQALSRRQEKQKKLARQLQPHQSLTRTLEQPSRLSKKPQALLQLAKHYQLSKLKLDRCHTETNCFELSMQGQSEQSLRFLNQIQPHWPSWTIEQFSLKKSQNNFWQLQLKIHESS